MPGAYNTCLLVSNHLTDHSSCAHLLLGSPQAVCQPLPAPISQGKVQLLTNPATWANTFTFSWASSDMQIFCAKSCSFHMPLVRFMWGRSLTSLVFLNQHHLHSMQGDNASDLKLTFVAQSLLLQLQHWLHLPLAHHLCLLYQIPCHPLSVMFWLNVCLT